MQPRILKRWNSKLAVPKSRKGRKGHLYGAELAHPLPSPEEQVRITTRRVQKAERDERMDITLALTPPKTYMGGFTRPRDLRAANWFPGGPYLQKNKIYESPPQSAYEPHTVFLLQTRYRVRQGIGRVDARDHIVGVCRAVDFVKLVRKYNSGKGPHEVIQSMDNACWPWLPKSGKVLKPTRWWGKDENLEDIMKEIHEDDNYTSNDVSRILREAEEEAEEREVQNVSKMKCVAVQAERDGERAGPPSSALAEPTSENLRGASSSGTSQTNPPPDPPSTPVPEGTSLRAEPPHMIGVSHRTSLNADSVRAEYIPRLASEPFWLPLLAITFSTRPLALTVSRLSKAQERGLPFYATMTNDDRKCLFSYSNRMTNMRLDRMRQLTLEAVKRLAGHEGGFVGIRFGVHDKGRGIGGESLADPIRPDKRIVKVRVGNWYGRAEEQCELFTEGTTDWGGRDAVDVALMNEWGRRLDAEGNELPLTQEETSTEEVEEMEDEVEAEEDSETDEDDILRSPTVPGIKKFKLKPVLRGDDEVAAALRRKLAHQRGQGHRSVIRV